MAENTEEDEQIRERPHVTRRAVLRTGIAVFSGKTFVGRGAGSSNVTTGRQAESVVPADDHKEKQFIGYVFHPEHGTFHETVPFQIVVRFRESEASIGRGTNVCEEPRQAYIPYGIRYLDPEETTAFLAVPRTQQQNPLPDEYFVLPRTAFHFTETDGAYIFKGACEESPTPVQHGVFTRVV